MTVSLGIALLAAAALGLWSLRLRGRLGDARAAEARRQERQSRIGARRNWDDA